MAKSIPLQRKGQGESAGTKERTPKESPQSEKASKVRAQSKVAIAMPDIRQMKVRIIGDTSLISHKFSDKSQKMIEDKQQQKAKQARGKRDPEQEYRDSMYELGKDKYGFPASGFKKAMVNACSHVSGITKVLARGAFYVMGDYITILKAKPQMRTDFVRIGNGRSADIRYRGEFVGWEAELAIRYNANVISAEQILNLLATAGFSIGVGDWRPEKDGTHGMFTISTAAA